MNVEPGSQFGQWTVLRHSGEESGRGKFYWVCRCSCGNELRVFKYDLLGGKSTKCRECFSTHGMTGRPGYNSWMGIKGRCLNPNNKDYKNYGGRGIRVCDRWMDFENFWEDMGSSHRSGLQIERENNHGDYEPGNCRWETPKNQSNNKRNNKMLSAFGKTQTLSRWADEFSMSRSTLGGRILRGIPIEEALTTKVDKSTWRFKRYIHE